ncbi:carbohydrate kinase [Ruficoccus amylovorans]|uniref:Carbohydrate kinase n=1 Tax=Ruficoccus amylovorans TaxID=1804625 RepID=A0A842HGF6_9BACT|nr:carbohydrate kinase [Ruficoccus amylovorans]MBC2595108.1 carbohydrate kinase [Ruficoccus amylovorans]
MEKIVCFGEVLWDCLPKGLFLGGAPFNAACHLRRLGCRPVMISAVGDDFLGEEALLRAQAQGLDTFAFTVKKGLRTGVAKVVLDDSGCASYVFPEPCAWDRIELGEAARNELTTANAILFGSLAARSERNAEQLDSILSETHALRIFDVNLRPPHDDLETVLELAQKADVLKVNETELAVLSGRPFDSGDLEGAIRAVVERTHVRKVCVTLGGEGAAYFDGRRLLRAEAPLVQVRDTVGAGDSFTAAFTAGLVRGDAPQETLERACRLGAYVASCDGATPEYDPAEVLG